MKLWKEVSPYTGMEIGEDAPTNAAGAGNVAGIGVGPHGEPGVDPKKKKDKIALIDRNGKIDGRFKAYREHRKKLEAARQKRLERKEARASKFISNIKKKTTEMAYGQGFDTAKPMADMSNINASKKKKKK
jgi:hypothetical protein